MIAAEDVVGYAEAVESVLESFEARDAYLEDVPVADTVLVLQALAGAARHGRRAWAVGAAARRAEAQRRAAAARSSSTIVRWPRTRLAGVVR